MKIVILGGGTAGWLTALFVRKILPQAYVTLIQSKTLGIIGVGEATTPNIPGLLRELSIDTLEVIKYTSGTIKNGISFENWNGDNKKYFHGFRDTLVNFSVSGIFSNQCEDWYLKNLLSKNYDLNDNLLFAKLSYENKVDINNTAWSMHFDANKFAEFLQIKGIDRRIHCIEANLVSTKLDDNGFVKQLQLDTNEIVDLDFLFDCSGFSREIIGNLYKEKWISYSRHLPMKKAIPFWLENEQDLNPYTSAIAMKNGWVWKIPLQNRIGSGYIFDSDYINVDQALSEAEVHFKRKLDIRKIIEFDAGRYENFWVKNTIAVGLSSSFIEPLESTSLFLTVLQLETLKHYINDMFKYSETSTKKFNKIVSANMEDTLAFVYFHYLTKRRDSKFWKEFKEKNAPPDSLLSKLDDIRSANCKFTDFVLPHGLTVFGLFNYMQVAKGLDFIDQKVNLLGYKEINPPIDIYKNLINDVVKNAPTLREFLQTI
jgi:tryptophan halogenase